MCARTNCQISYLTFLEFKSTMKFLRRDMLIVNGALTTFRIARHRKASFSVQA